MGKKDITEKKLEDFAEVFADIINVLLFDGEKRVSLENVENGLTVSTYKAQGKVHSQDRDSGKRPPMLY